MSKKSKNLVQIAGKVLDRAIAADPWQPNTSQIQAAYGLSEQQVAEVKKHVKKAAAAYGLTWSYDPAINAFRIAPANAPNVYHRMVAYAYDQLASQTKSVSHLFDGGVRKRYITKPGAEQAKGRNAESAKFVKETFNGLKIKGATPGSADYLAG